MRRRVRTSASGVGAARVSGATIRKALSMNIGYIVSVRTGHTSL
jgi:hypothetical protein